MKVAQISLFSAGAPFCTCRRMEHVVSCLAEALTAQGHDVTLFTSELSTSGARPDIWDHWAGGRPSYSSLMLQRIRERAAEFDILHFHTDQLHFPLLDQSPSLTVVTVHGPLDPAEVGEFCQAFPDVPLISISNHQRELIPAGFIGTIYDGVSERFLKPVFRPRGGYAAFFGPLLSENVKQAIAIADSFGVPLKIASEAGASHQSLLHAGIAPFADGFDVEFLGGLSDAGRAAFLGEASALMFPMDWPGPFAHAAVEAMACGTPVLAFARGSLAEIVEDGVTGALIDSMSAAPRALGRVMGLDRRVVRRRFEERFSSARMASDYADAYQTLLSKRRRAATTKGYGAGVDRLIVRQL